MDIKERLKMDQSRLWHNFEMCTKDLKSIEIEKIRNETIYTSKVKYLNVNHVEPYMIYFIFVTLLEFEHTYQPMEKVLYEIPFEYKEHLCMFSMSKYGLDFSINIKNEEVIESLFKKIGSASKIAARLLMPILTESIDNGEVTIENQSGILRQRYMYFRDRVEKIYKDEVIKDTKNLLGMHNGMKKVEKEIIFNTQAMIDAYFSFQEHLLILLLPFTTINFKEERVTSLMNENWTNKFTKIFTPDKKPDMMRRFTLLKKLKETRNKHAHGGFENGEGSLHSHVEGLGVIPFELPSNSEDLFSLAIIKDVSFEKACKTIDVFESYLDASNWSRAIQILIAGIDMRFDKEYMEELKIAIESDSNLESFLEKEFYIYDREANMDW